MSSPLKILLVGQNDDGLALVKEILVSDDLEVAATAGLGPAAVTWARNIEPDVVVVVADDSVARPVAVIQALAHGDPGWTVVAMAESFERELVRQAMLVGARDVLVRTSPPAELREAIVTARQADLARRAPGTQGASSSAGKILSLVGVKGGIGKTTSAINLAVCLAQESLRSVALVDLDLPFGDLAILLNLKPEGSVYSVLADPSAILSEPELLQRQLVRGPAGIEVLSAPLAANGQPPIDSAQVGPMLTHLAGLYDFVVVDTAGGFGELTAAALDVTTQALVMTTAEGPTLRRTELGLRQLAQWNFPSNKIKVVVNRATMRTGISSEEVASILSQPIAWWLPDEPNTLKAAASAEPLVLSQPKLQISRTYRSMARQLAGLPPEARRSFAFGWFNRPAVAFSA
jgi:pilus assembly protein CpaE